MNGVWGTWQQNAPKKIMNNFNNNHKLILLGIIAVLVMFFSYNLYLSPYQKCVSGLIEEGEYREDALVVCMKR